MMADNNVMTRNFFTAWVHFPKVEHCLTRRHKAHKVKKIVVRRETCPLFFIYENNRIGHGQAGKFGFVRLSDVQYLSFQDRQVLFFLCAFAPL